MFLVFCRIKINSIFSLILKNSNIFHCGGSGDCVAVVWALVQLQEIHTDPHGNGKEKGE